MFFLRSAVIVISARPKSQRLGPGRYMFWKLFWIVDDLLEPELLGDRLRHVDLHALRHRGGRQDGLAGRQRRHILESRRGHAEPDRELTRGLEPGRLGLRLGAGRAGGQTRLRRQTVASTVTIFFTLEPPEAFELRTESCHCERARAHAHSPCRSLGRALVTAVRLPRCLRALVERLGVLALVVGRRLACRAVHALARGIDRGAEAGALAAAERPVRRARVGGRSIVGGGGASSSSSAGSSSAAGSAAADGSGSISLVSSPGALGSSASGVIAGTRLVRRVAPARPRGGTAAGHVGRGSGSGSGSIAGSSAAGSSAAGSWTTGSSAAGSSALGSSAGARSGVGLLERRERRALPERVGTRGTRTAPAPARRPPSRARRRRARRPPARPPRARRGPPRRVARAARSGPRACRAARRPRARRSRRPLPRTSADPPARGRGDGAATSAHRGPAPARPLRRPVRLSPTVSPSSSSPPSYRPSG